MGHVIAARRGKSPGIHRHVALVYCTLPVLSYTYTAGSEGVECVPFFGNDVPKALVYRLYHARNQETTELVRELFYEWYFIRQKSKYTGHMFMYYNMCMKQYVHLNGSYLNKLEPVESVVGELADVTSFGIDNTCCPNLLRSMLERVRAEQV